MINSKIIKAASRPGKTKTAILAMLPATSRQIVASLGMAKSAVNEALRILVAQKLIYPSAKRKGDGDYRPVAVYSAGQGETALPVRPPRKRRASDDTNAAHRASQREAALMDVVGALKSMGEATAAQIGDALGIKSQTAAAILRAAGDRGLVFAVRKGDRQVYTPIASDEPREVLRIDYTHPPVGTMPRGHWAGAGQLLGKWSRA